MWFLRFVPEFLYLVTIGFVTNFNYVDQDSLRLENRFFLYVFIIFTVSRILPYFFICILY